MRGSLLFCLALLLPTPLCAEPPDLYTAQLIVTGVDIPSEYRRALDETMDEVVVRLTGMPELAGSPRIAPLRVLAPVFERSHSYRDRLEGKPKHDDQGTRERPHFLTITYDRDLLRRGLAALDLPVWDGPRPPVRALLTVDAMGKRVEVGAGDAYEPGYGPRETLRSLARRRGVEVRFPGEAASEGEAQLTARLTESADGFWSVEWTAAMAGGRKQGRVERTTYDVGLRSALDDLLALARPQP